LSLERPPSPPTAGSDEIFEAGAESLRGEAVDEEVEGTTSVKVGIRKTKHFAWIFHLLTRVLRLAR